MRWVAVLGGWAAVHSFLALVAAAGLIATLVGFDGLKAGSFVSVALLYWPALGALVWLVWERFRPLRLA